MKLLFVDTATSVCSVAVADGSRILAESLINLATPSSSRLADCIGQAAALAGCCLADLDGFGVTIGPGAFTGLRVGISTVKGLALAMGKPVVTFSSLAVLAANSPSFALPVCPLFDARKDEVYAGLYRCAPLPLPLRPDCVMPPAAFIASLTGPTYFVGDGAVRYRAMIEELLGERASFAPDWANLPRAAAVATLATRVLEQGGGISPANVLPVYLRLSEAEVARQSVLQQQRKTFL